MDFALLELILWIGLVFFFWALKDNLGHVESDIDAAAVLKRGKAGHMNHSLFVNPDQVIEPIGCYQECQIYRFAIVNGTTYRFDHILPAGTVPLVGEDRCCLAPGLVYVACAAQHADSRGNNPSKWNA